MLLSAGVRKIDPPGPKPIRGDLNRAEFDAMDATVRYYDGLASYAEFSAATEHLKLLRLATDFERRQAVRNLWRRRPGGSSESH